MHIVTRALLGVVWYLVVPAAILIEGCGQVGGIQKVNYADLELAEIKGAIPQLIVPTDGEPTDGEPTAFDLIQFARPNWLSLSTSSPKDTVLSPTILADVVTIDPRHGTSRGSIDTLAAIVAARVTGAKLLKPEDNYNRRGRLVWAIELLLD